MDKLRIGLIAPPWLPVPPPCYGGTEEVIDLLATGLVAAGHDVRLFATGDSTCPVDRSYVYPEAERVRLGATVPELYHTLAAYQALGDCQIIHDHTVAGLFVAPQQTGPPVVTTSHGPFTHEMLEIYRAAQDRVAIVAISHDQASRSDGVAISRVIHHGIDPAKYPIGPGAGGYLLFLGRMSPDKGIHRAARVARAAGRRLMIAAKMQEPLEREYFEKQVKPLLGEDIIYVGEADRESKKELLADAVALINPIRWPEPFGLVMIEALASGTPVVTFSEGSAPEIVEDGINGFLCHDEAEMVESLERLDEIHRDVCRHSFEKRFSSQRMVADHMELYQELLASKSLSSAAA